MPPSKRITLREIAHELGVSHVTVSLALKNHPRISPERRAEVQNLATKMGYVPDPMLSSLVVYRHKKRILPIQNALAWINHWKDPGALRQLHEFDAYWGGASETAERFGYHVEEFIWKPEYSPSRMETILKTRNIRGVLIPPHPFQPNWGDFHWENFSVIRFGTSVKKPHTHVVTSDQMQTMRLAVQEMTAKGYTRIGLILQDSFDLRLDGNPVAGFQAAQRLLDLPHRLPPLLYSENKEKLSGVIKHWIDQHKPDAILTCEIIIPQMIRDLGYRIPEDMPMASTSVYDIPILNAGINQSSEEIGRVAVQTLIALINDHDRGKPAINRRILVEGTWQDGSTLPPRK